MDLYPDQLEVIRQTREAMKRHKSVLIQAATGFGKSVLSSYMIHSALSKGHTCGFFVPRRELLRQMTNTFRGMGIPHSYVAAGYPYRPIDKVHIHSIGTSIGRLSSIPAPSLAFIDEIHYGGGSLDEVVAWLKASGSFIIGLSATPWKMSGKGLGCYCDAMVQGPSVRSLIDSGRLSDYRMFAPSMPDLSGIKITAGDYAKGQLSEVMEQDNVLIGNAVGHYKKHANGMLNLAFCVSRKHSEIVAQSFRDAGIPAMHMDGNTKDIDRQRIIRGFANREIKVITNVDLCTFGFDLSAQVGMDVTVEAMSDLRPTKSLALQSQKWGRVLRRKDFPAIILDHSGNYINHGKPDDDRSWTLSDREKKSGGTGEKTLPIRQCTNCFFVHSPAPSCPTCGHVYPIQYREIEEVEGELEEVVIQRKKDARMEVGKAKTLADLKRIQEERGYAPGWIFTQAKIKGIKS